MNRRERVTLSALVHYLATPSVASVTYTPSSTHDGRELLTRTEHCTPSEASRLLRSPEYRAGWRAARRAILETLVEFDLPAARLALEQKDDEP
jgi:hypothetical protein